MVNYFCLYFFQSFVKQCKTKLRWNYLKTLLADHILKLKYYLCSIKFKIILCDFYQK